MPARPVSLLTDPVAPHERIQVIDILRGYALFGVLLINMRNFDFPGEKWTGTADQVALWLTIALADSKFWTLFSFLFGLGFALQWQRAEAHGARFLPLYVRRLVILLLFGFLHHIIYFGDILFDYALAGFVLLFFRARSSKTVLLIAGVCFAITLLSFALDVRGRERQAAQSQMVRLTPEEAKQRQAEEVARRQEDQDELRVLTHGSFTEVTALNARWFAQRYSSLRPYLWNPGGPGGILGSVLPLFLLGLYAGRRRIFQDLSSYLPFIRKLMWWGLGLGLAATLVSVGAHWPDAVVPYSRRVRYFTGILWFVGTPALSFGYASAIILLVQEKELWRKRLTFLGALGRMALTNYLLMSLIFTTMFFGYGLGLYGVVGPSWNVVLSLFIYTGLAAFSLWWLQRFRFGPAEWLWRSLTYGKLQPMRLPGAVAAAS